VSIVSPYRTYHASAWSSLRAAAGLGADEGLVSDSVSSPIAPAIRPPAVAAADDERLTPGGWRHRVPATAEVLLPAEGAHRVDTRGAQSGDVTSQKGDEGNAQRGGGYGDGVVGLDSVELRPHHTRQTPGGG